ncbi:hypothetical protein BJ878DRAFT_524233 [Calycina marina]|uniref:Uncharacterized protein n=1 Tax=Calycina marina TaxID=1763456 RepID=A0A9P7YW19_9HELO|nr:hypothetical protein BJ878DRAFT_524233 [Calycina marina]
MTQLHHKNKHSPAHLYTIVTPSTILSLIIMSTPSKALAIMLSSIFIGCAIITLLVYRFMRAAQVEDFPGSEDKSEARPSGKIWGFIASFQRGAFGRTWWRLKE